MSNFFVGSIDGSPVVAAQTLIPAEQDRVAIVVDSMTTRYGTRMPEFQKGWLLRAIDPELPRIRVVQDLESTGATVKEVGDVSREDAAQLLGPAVINDAFKRDDQ